MDFETFCKKYRCSVTEKRIEIGNRCQRLISVKTYYIYIDIRTMLPFKPDFSNEIDRINCVTMRAESSISAKQKAYDFIKDSNSLTEKINAM